MSQPVLIVVGGLPATGKTTVARQVARDMRAAYLRVDTIEAAIGRAEGRHERANQWESPPGYCLGYDLANDQLGVGLDVVAESVNPVQLTRDAWRAAGLRAGARTVEVEFICSDPAEHRYRVENRAVDVAGMREPTWDEIIGREYEPWARNRLVIDTAILEPEDAARLIQVEASA